MSSSPPASSTPLPPCTSVTERTTMFDYRSMFDLTDKKALVVGAGRGIGEAGAHALAAFGAIVFCADADADAAESTATEARSQGWTAEAVELDMLDRSEERRVG